MREWSQDEWVGADGGPLIRPYAVTGGRTRPARAEVQLISLVTTVRPATRLERLQPEHYRTMALCRVPTAVVEIAALLNLPTSVVKVLVSDLLEHHLVIVSSPAASTHTDVGLIQAVIDGIRNL